MSRSEREIQKHVRICEARLCLSFLKYVEVLRAFTSLTDLSVLGLITTPIITTKAEFQHGSAAYNDSYYNY